jgi:hypothetical protein
MPNLIAFERYFFCKLIPKLIWELVCRGVIVLARKSISTADSGEGAGRTPQYGVKVRPFRSNPNARIIATQTEQMSYNLSSINPRSQKWPR